MKTDRIAMLASNMSSDSILALLIAERDKLDRAIEALGASTKRRGRPARTWSVPAVGAPAPFESAPAKKGRRTFTAAQRKAQGERMKALWARRRKEAAKK
jgi:hypothetical protein